MYEARRQRLLRKVTFQQRPTEPAQQQVSNTHFCYYFNSCLRSIYGGYGLFSPKYSTTPCPALRPLAKQAVSR